jgi:hypothetical protein
MNGVIMSDMFQNWFENQWYQIIYGERWKNQGSRSALRVALEYFLLFLDSPVPPMAHANAKHKENKQWRAELLKLEKQGCESFKKFWKENIAQLRGSPRHAPKTLSAFKKVMVSNQVTAEMIATLPGHAIHASFQAKDGETTKPLRCKADILQAKIKRAENDVTRRALEEAGEAAAV